jgi:long-subunit acyl-CoA synthetase (AMP-forming)
VLESLEARPATHVALIAQNRQYTAAELAAAIRCEVSWLAGHGGSRHALLADNGAPWIVADAALFARATLAVPIPASFTPSQVDHVLRDAGIDRLSTDHPQRWLDAMPGLSVIGRSPVTGLSLLSRRADSGAAAAPAGTVKVTYTSGSTGAPKGICLDAQSMWTVTETVARLAVSLDLRRHLCLLPLPTLLENIAGVYAPLMAGATVIVPPLAAVGMSYAGVDAARLVAAISTHRPESLILVPELLKLLVLAAERGWQAPDSLKFVAVGGAHAGRELIDRALAHGLPACEGYGLSECTSVVSLNVPGAARAGSVGRPLPHVSVRIASDGEILVRGALMAGVLGAGAAAVEELATGDLGEIDADGFLHVRGRKRDMFVTSFGRNVSPEWIESLILESAAVRYAVVFGEGRAHPVAVIAPMHDDVADTAIERAIESANARLPDYARIRGWVRADGVFSFAQGLLTANGRPRRDRIYARHVALLDALDGTAVLNTADRTGTASDRIETQVAP